MNRNKYCIANWKMNFNKTDIIKFITQLNSKKLNQDVITILSPSFIDIDVANSLLEGTDILVAAQNISNKYKGAYTGDVSAYMLKEYNCNWVILGHSERRTIYGENNKLINQKLDIVIQNKLNFILCIGETIEQRNSNKTIEVLTQQLSILKDRNMNNLSMLIAYEPIWSIGTGLTATEEIISSTHSSIRKILNHIGYEGNSISILYGGSVNDKNSTKLAKINELDGFLVGGASLDIDKFHIINNEL